MTRGLTASLREAPATVPALAALALFIVWGTDQAGYPVTHWAPGALIVLALIALTVVIVGVRISEIPPAVRIALGCLAGYTALSYLSILWAGVKASAWEGANRTLLYLLVFALFACWRQRGRTAALLVGAWSAAMIVLATVVALHIDGASAARIESMLPGGRLSYPSGYVNANAALWLIAFWPALLLACSERLPWGVRGFFAGGAVVLADVALLSQSRGSLYATPVMLVLVFALLPNRTRTFALLVPVAAGIGASARAILRVGDHLRGEEVVASTLHTAIATAFAAAVAVGVLVAIGAAVESRGHFSERFGRRLRHALGASAIVVLVLVLGAGWAAAGNPVSRLHHAWETFKSPSGYAANADTGSRLTSGLGSNRYDFYRVALDEFAAHPVLGIGADNFQQQYLAHGRSDETPHYPHSIELRTLVQTGLLGGLLALVGLGAALAAAARALRPPGGRATDPLACQVAAAALAGFGYWIVHGSFDWFWEFAGLGAPAFALLGIACALAPRASAPYVLAEGPAAVARLEGSAEWRQAEGRSPEGVRARSGLARSLGWVAGAVILLAAALTFTAPWLSELQIETAARIWSHQPQRAYARLSEAAQMNPLSDEAYLVAGTIALRFGDLARADREFTAALSRDPGDAYATLELGAIVSNENRPARALMLLERAVRLDPRDPLARSALQVVRVGKRIDVEELNRALLLEALQFA